MGTRGVNGFVLNGKYQGQYNQFDTYPSGLGAEMVKLARRITKNEGWNKFKRNAGKLQDVGTKELPENHPAIQLYADKFGNTEVSHKDIRDPYCLFRNLQGIEFLQEVYQGNLLYYRDEAKFMKDSLFCEYAWFFNLDNMTFECWKGFQTTQPPFNPFGEDKLPDWLNFRGEIVKQEYYPCIRAGVFNLIRIPRKWVELAFPEEPFDEEEPLDEV